MLLKTYNKYKTIYKSYKVYSLNIEVIKNIIKFLISEKYNIKLFCILDLQNYIILNENEYKTKNKNPIKYLSHQKKVDEIIHSSVVSIDEYDLDQDSQVLKEVFFSLIAAIFIDSNINNIFELLWLLYVPGMLYYINYMYNIEKDLQQNIYIDIGNYVSDDKRYQFCTIKLNKEYIKKIKINI